MKRYNYTLGNAVSGPLKVIIVVYIVIYPIFYFLMPDLVLVIPLILILITSLVAHVLYLSYRPDVPGEWIIDEEKGIIEKHRFRDRKYQISDIEEIRYAREGVLSLKLKKKGSMRLYFKIVEEERDDFEREMKKLSEKYGFTFFVLWKKKYIEIGKTEEEITNHSLKTSKGVQK